MSDQHEKAHAYNTAVGGVGYAGTLTIFSLTHDLLPVWAKATVALCLLVSLLFYVGWVVGTMYVGVRLAQGGGQTLARCMMATWHAVLSLTIIPALGAAALLGWFYIQKILA